MQHGKHGGGLQGGAIVAVEHGLVSQTVDTFHKGRTPRKMRCVVRIIGVGDGVAHDLAAVEIENEIQVEPAPCDLGR